jgi:hypothetical protein
VSTLRLLSDQIAKQQTAAAVGHKSTTTTDIYLNAGNPAQEKTVVQPS